MSVPEMNLLNQDNARETGGVGYQTASPFYFGATSAIGVIVQSNGYFGHGNVSTNYTIRPAISLKSGIEYSSGDGSKANPYVVDTN